MKLLQTLVGLTLAVAAALPANAAPSTCWIGINERGGRIPPQSCDVKFRRNYNGHKVIDVTTTDGTTASIVLWVDDYRNPSFAEFFVAGERYRMNYRWDAEGDLHLWVPDAQGRVAHELYVAMPPGERFDKARIA